MAFWAVFDRWPVRVVYIVVAAILSAVTVQLFQLDASASWISLLVTACYLGPLGFAGVVLLAFPMLLVADVSGPKPPWIFAYVLVAAGIALWNIGIVSRRRRRHDALAAEGNPVSRSRTVDSAVGAGLFLLAGSGFILLCYFAGFELFTAPGIDSPVPNSVSAPIILAASLAWWSGFAVALAGLAIWIVQTKRRRRILPWAIGDFVIMVGLNAVLFAVFTANPG
jgi:hypothetical protein